MKDLEKRAEEYLKAKWGTNKMLILGGDARKVLADFAQSETALLSQHILDLQKTNGALTDRVNEATEIIREYMNLANLPLKPYSQTTISYPKEMVKRSEDLIAKAEAFLKE